ncbi:MAG: hydrogenase nickel incorporation protein HypB [Planctomycetota bacterium]|jgi:hydrogenase nickel incorporation protein HypB
MNREELVRKVELKRKILAANEAAAADLRRDFEEAGALVIDLISSPGAGKTALLEETARRLSATWRMAAVVGDVATDLDAERLRVAGLPARQISTGGACHLEARMVDDAIRAAAFGDLDILFIENVGNLICPTSFDLGEDSKVALLSVAEGHDKPFKYPGIFSKAGITVITKSDLLPHVEFDVDVAKRQIRTLNPDARIILTSVRTGRGLDEWTDLIAAQLRAKRSSFAAV